jgi:hypothetical protein
MINNLRKSDCCLTCKYYIEDRGICDLDLFMEEWNELMKKGSSSEDLRKGCDLYNSHFVEDTDICDDFERK